MGRNFQRKITYGAPYKRHLIWWSIISTAHMGVYIVFTGLSQILVMRGLLRFSYPGLLQGFQSG